MKVTGIFFVIAFMVMSCTAQVNKTTVSFIADLQSKPGYSVRFANHDVWDATKGYNLLTNNLIIKK